MGGLEFTLILILLFVVYLISYYFSTNGITNAPIIKTQNITKNTNPTIVIFGATSSLGQKVLNILKDKPFNIIAVSRRERRWLKIKDAYPTVAWRRGDIRLSQDLDALFEQIKLDYGGIDWIINLTNIVGKANITPISSLRVKTDVFCKLSQGYDTELLAHSHPDGSLGAESPLFTNIIGLIVLKNACIQYKIPNVMLLTGTDPVVNELIKSIVAESNRVTQFMSYGPLDMPDKINRLLK